MSEVEQFYYAIATKMGCTLTWNELNFMEQQQFVAGINMILSVVTGQPEVINEDQNI